MNLRSSFLTLLFYILITCSLEGQERTLGLQFNSEASQQGYTLFGNNETTYLIDNCGYVVNDWQSEYKAGHGMYFFENGTLLRQGAMSGNFDAGGRGGIFELFDWEGNIIWTIQIAEENLHTHHDMALLPNGNFLCIAWERYTEQEAQKKGRIYEGEVWSERIMEIKILPNNNYEIVWEWSIWDHLIQDVDSSKPNYGVVRDNPNRLDINYIGENGNTSGNWLHANAIDYNEKLSQIVFSSRLLSEVYVIDHSTSTAEAKTSEGGRYGKGGDILYRYGNPQVYQNGTEENRQLSGPHSISWIPEGYSNAGNFIVFNNEYIAGQQSRIQVFESPANENGFYKHEPNKGFGLDTLIRTVLLDGLYSDILSAVQALPNGNLLITEGRSGNYFEIDSNDNVVWHYINPVNRNGAPGIQGSEPRFNMVFKAERYDSNFLGFAEKNLSRKAPIEISPVAYDCQISNNEIVTATTAVQLALPSIFFNANTKQLNLIWPDGAERKLNIIITDILGRVLYQAKVVGQDANLSVPSSGLGIKFVLVEGKFGTATFRLFF